MAADFWRSSHGNYWLIDKKTLAAARALDLKYATPTELAWVAIWSANAIHKLTKRLSLRQQVTATAIVYFRRFYLKNAYCETDLPLVAAACVYIAAKAEETAMHIKLIITEARATFSEYGITNFPSDTTKLAEMEFYMLEDLEFHLIVWHPYRSLIHLTGRDTGPQAIRESMVEMDDNSLQMAWFVLNDTYRSSDMVLLYPPHLIAVASMYVAFALHTPASIFGTPGSAGSGQESKAATEAAQAKAAKAQTAAPTAPQLPRGKVDPVTWLASLNAPLDIVFQIVQEILSIYPLWKSYEETSPVTGTGSETQAQGGDAGSTATGSLTSMLSSPSLSNKPSPQQQIVNLGLSNPGAAPNAGDERVVQILNRMRMNREMDLAHPNTGIPVRQ